MENNPLKKLENKGLTKQQKEAKLMNAIAPIYEAIGLDLSDYKLSYLGKMPKPAPNIQVFQTAAYLAATSLSSGANKLLMLFLSFAEFENLVSMDIKTIVENVGLKERSVYASIKELEQSGIVIRTKDRQDRRRNDYFINPMSAWKGKTLTRKIAMAKMSKDETIQLHLFGETYENNMSREEEEIKKKLPLHLQESNKK